MIILRTLPVVSSIVSIAFACSCRDLGSEAAYCKAEFVSKVKVDQIYDLTMDNQTYETLYTVKHLTIFKSVGAHLDSEIRTPYHESMCGVRLRKGEEIVLSGSRTACGFLRIDSCNRIEDSFDTNKFKQINCSKLVVI